MSLSGRVPRGPGPEGDGHGATSAGRGAVLIGAGVVAGLLILTTIDNPGPATSTPRTTEPDRVVTVPVTNADGTPVTNPDGTPVTVTVAPTTTTRAKKSSGTDGKAARPNEEVVVQVLNGSGVQGAATQRGNDLVAKGYQVLPAGNAPAQRNGNAVQCKADFAKEAQVLVQELGTLGVTAAVEPVPDPLPAGFDAAANCYVILGK